MHSGHPWEPGETCWVSWCCPSPLAQNGEDALPCQWCWRTKGSVVSWAAWTKGAARCDSSCVKLLSPISLLAHLLQMVTALWNLPGAAMFPLKVGTAGEEAGKKVVIFFKSCLGFCLPGFFPPGECTAHCFRLVFAFQRFLWNNQTIWGCVRCFCILSPNQLGEKE